MSRLLRFAAAIAALIVLSGTACKKNSPPGPPDITGQTTVRPGQAVTYGFTSVDPDGDSVAYMVSWGDGTPTEWSSLSPSDSEYDETHTYSNIGTYFITAKAKDLKNNESAWSDSLQITVALNPPNAPIRPQGKTACTTGVAYDYTTRAMHPTGDSVQIQFYWGGGAGDTSAWGQMVASNHNYGAAHVFTSVGAYKIAARARDAFGLESPWSESLTVTVDTAVHVDTSRQAHHIVLSAATDTTVNITWVAPADTGLSRYVILFREVGTTAFDSVGGTVSSSFIHDPAHKTGRYQVTAVFANGRFPSAETPTTTPVDNIQRAVPELNGGGNAGYGWDRTSGGAALHDMTNADTAALVDFYVTDFNTGHAGPLYSLASPFLAQTDLGGLGIIPYSSYWWQNHFAYLDSGASEDNPLPRPFSGRYRDSTVLDTFPISIACFTYDSFFGLVKTNDIDTSAGTANIETWFQLIKKLRLIEH